MPKRPTSIVPPSPVDEAAESTARKRRAQEFLASQAARLAALEQLAANLKEDSLPVPLITNAPQAKSAASATRQAATSGEQELAEAWQGLRSAEARLAAQQATLAQSQARLKQQQFHLAAEREALDAEIAETNEQRRRIAAHLQGQRIAQRQAWEERQAENEQLRADLEERRIALERRRADAQNRADADAEEQSAVAAEQKEAVETRTQLAQLRRSLARRAEELAEARNELHESRRQTAKLETELEELREAHDRLSQQLAVQAAIPLGQAGANALQAQCDRLQQELDECESKLTDADQLRTDSRKKDDLQRRFEMAVDEVRQQKRRIADLEHRLKGPPDRPAPVSSDRGDWETQKRRLLESLEAEFDAENESDRAERLTIEGTIRITDQVVADKDREIDELKQMLDAQSSNLGSVAVGAAAIASMLDSDELVQIERQKLKDMQVEWEGKLRRAEIDISLERAKIARDRLEIDGKLQDLASSPHSHADESDSHKHGKQPAKNRWLTRLGLKENDA